MRLSNVKVLDCTIRDGGYINNWQFPLDFVKALYRAVSEAGVDYIESGFVFGESRETKSPWANYDPAVYRELLASVPNGCKVSGLLNYGGFDINEIPSASESHFDMLRLVCHRVDASAATETAAILAQKGYETTINYMAISNYTPVQLFELIQIINEYKKEVGFFYVADSFGSLMPNDTRRIVDTLKYGTQANLGFHPHNNLQMAFANSLAAIDAGANIVDGSVFGMGRGAGNLFTEVVVAYLEAQGESRYQLLPLLQFADLFMEPLREQYSWGISLPQMISGILHCHPNYPTNLLSFKMHTADDIYRMLKALPQEQRGRFKSSYMDEALSKFITVKTQRGNVVSEGLHRAVKTHDHALLLCGGSSVQKYQTDLSLLAKKENCYVIAVNNPNPPVKADAVFFGNQRRLLQHHEQVCDEQEVILGPTINEKAEESLRLEKVSRMMLKNAKEAGVVGFFPKNSGIMAMLACAELGFKTVHIAGLDGFVLGGGYYYAERDAVDDPIALKEMDAVLRGEWKAVSEFLKGAGCVVEVVTPTSL